MCYKGVLFLRRAGGTDADHGIQGNDDAGEGGEAAVLIRSGMIVEERKQKREKKWKQITEY